MIGQQSLNNFYQSILFSDVRMASLMREDIFCVSLNALGADNSGGKEAAARLRRQAFNLPELHRRVLESALTDLGYS